MQTNIRESNAIHFEETYVFLLVILIFFNLRKLMIWKTAELDAMHFSKSVVVACERPRQSSHSTSTTLLHPDLSEGQLMVMHELVDDLVMVVMVTSAQHPTPQVSLRF